MVDWPPSLVQDLARRRVVVVLGSGVSKHSEGKGGARPPTWKEFLEKACADCPAPPIPPYISKAIQDGDLLHACEWLKSRFDEDWPSYLRKVFQTPRFKPAPIHDAILKLDNRIIFSLNFDNIYERNANQSHAGSHIVKNYYDKDISEFLRGSGRYIVKIHGSLDSPDNLIFTQKDYSAARVKNAAFYELFDAALLSHSFLFIGSGYSDPDVNLALENQKFSFPSSHPHYFLTSVQDNPDLKRSLRDNRNLKTIEYDKIDDLHTGLVAAVEDLVKEVDAERHDLLTSQDW